MRLGSRGDSRLLGALAVVQLAERVQEVVGATNEVNRVRQARLLATAGLDLGILQEELVRQSERRVFADRFPVAVAVLPDADEEMRIVLVRPIAVPGRRRLDVVEGELPLERIGSFVQV